MGYIRTFKCKGLMKKVKYKTQEQIITKASTEEEKNVRFIHLKKILLTEDFIEIDL